MNKEIWLTSNKIKRFQKICNVFFSIVIVLNIWIIIKPLISSFSIDDIGIFKLLSNNETYVVLGGIVVLFLVRFLVINFLAVSMVKILGDSIIV